METATELNYGLIALIALPLAFLLGWWASRMDTRQLRRSDQKASLTYLRGLNQLLNDEPDKAIDTFIGLAQQDAGSADLHFALGNLFRRRGEFERAVRVHEHLLQRADLKPAQRERAQQALAQDFTKAGLFDRAEAAWEVLRGGAHRDEAQLALLSLHERSRDWARAAAGAQALEGAGLGSFSRRMAHHRCEQALEAEQRGDPGATQVLLDEARSLAPDTPRPWLEQAEFDARSGRPAEALAHYMRLREVDREAFARVAPDASKVAMALDGPARTALREAVSSDFEAHPGAALLIALASLDGVEPGAHPAWARLAAAQPSLTAAVQGLAAPPADQWPQGRRETIEGVVADAARPLQRFRCAACGFESGRWFWQCPGCLGWDTFPPRRVDEL